MPKTALLGLISCYSYISFFSIHVIHAVFHNRTSPVLVLLIFQFFLPRKSRHHQISIVWNGFSKMDTGHSNTFSSSVRIFEASANPSCVMYRRWYGTALFPAEYGLLIPCLLFSSTAAAGLESCASKRSDRSLESVQRFITRFEKKFICVAVKKHSRVMPFGMMHACRFADTDMDCCSRFFSR